MTKTKELTFESTFLNVVELVLTTSEEENTNMKPSSIKMFEELTIPKIPTETRKKALADKDWGKVIQEFLNFATATSLSLWPYLRNGGEETNILMEKISLETSDAPETPKTDAEKAAALMGTATKRELGTALRLDGHIAYQFKVVGTRMYINRNPDDFLDGEVAPEKDAKALTSKGIETRVIKWTSTHIKQYIEETYAFMEEMKEWAKDPKKQSELIAKGIKEANDNIILIIEEEI